MYVEYAKGFKSGGYNYDDFDITTVRYDAEDSDTLTLGFRHTNDTWQLNTSLYASKVKNQQVETIRSDLSSYVDNAKDAMIYGLEIQGNYTLTSNWQASGALALTDATYGEFTSKGVDYTGNQLLYTPKYALRLSSQYFLYSHYFIDVAMQVDGKRYFDKENSQAQDAYALLDLSFGYEHENLSWRIYGTNITDERYYNHIATAGDQIAYNYGEPRRVGVRLTYTFD